MPRMLQRNSGYACYSYSAFSFSPYYAASDNTVEILPRGLSEQHVGMSGANTIERIFILLIDEKCFVLPTT